MAQTATPATTYLPLSRAARYLGVSVDTLRRRIADGSLPAVRIGPTGTLRVSIEALDNLLMPTTVGNDPVAAYIDRLVAAAPELSPEQRSKLATLLAPVATGGAR